MATIQLPPDFKDFLKLLNSHDVQYLIVGGYAVGFHGYPRATGDLDVWIAQEPQNARNMVNVLHAFGFGSSAVTEELFLKERQVIRMGVPPVRIEILTTVSGVDFSTCYSRTQSTEFDGIGVRIISLSDLKANKRACGRTKDLNDLEHLP